MSVPPHRRNDYPELSWDVRPTPTSVCPWCGQPTRVLYVHGHGQCEVCGTNIDECCRGESCPGEDLDGPAD